jgi:hypothetical protein
MGGEKQCAKSLRFVIVPRRFVPNGFHGTARKGFDAGARRRCDVWHARLAPHQTTWSAAVHLTRISAFVATFAVAAVTLSVGSAKADEEHKPLHHFRIVNATFDSVTGLAFAPPQDPVFHDMNLAAPLQGGLTSITVDVPGEGCMRDVRVTFRNGHTLVYPNLDLCRSNGLRLTAGGERTHGSVPLVFQSPAE